MYNVIIRMYQFQLAYGVIMEPTTDSLSDRKSSALQEFISLISQSGRTLSLTERSLVQSAFSNGFYAGTRCIQDDLDKVMGIDTATPHKPSARSKTAAGFTI